MKLYLYIYHYDNQSLLKYSFDAKETKKSINYTAFDDKRRLLKENINIPTVTISSVKVFLLDNDFNNENEIDAVAKQIIKDKLAEQLDKEKRLYERKIATLESSLNSIDSTQIEEKDYS